MHPDRSRRGGPAFGGGSLTRLVCPSCGAVHKAPFKPKPEDAQCECGGRRVLPSQAKPRKPLRGQGGKRKRSTLKQGRGFAVTKAQREKVQLLPCVACGRGAGEYVAIDAAHLWPRGKGGCDSEDCVIPLCRVAGGGGGCHRLFDEGRLELLPTLIERGYWAEMAHPIACHRVSPMALVKRLTCGMNDKREAA